MHQKADAVKQVATHDVMQGEPCFQADAHTPERAASPGQLDPSTAFLYAPHTITSLVLGELLTCCSVYDPTQVARRLDVAASATLLRLPCPSTITRADADHTTQPERMLQASWRWCTMHTSSPQQRLTPHATPAGTRRLACGQRSWSS